jgi:diaminopropionate ammonia-lyase
MVVTDDEAAAAVRELARAGVVGGASGAAGLAGALVASRDKKLRSQLGITSGSSVAVVNTEGATDPASYDEILGQGN